MKTEITSRGHTLSDFLKDYLDKRMAKIEKYLQGEGEVHVVFERESNMQIVEITLHAMHKTMHAKEEHEEVRDCIDNAVQKIESQIRKHKEKLTERRP
jgi:putative sigma-54 modulation protein